MYSLLSVILLILFSGCANRPPQETMTSGTANIGASDAVKELAWYMSREFQNQSPKAFVDIYRMDTQSLLDSLVNNRVEEIFIDRALTQQESLAFQQQNLKLFTYPVAYYPVYLLVPLENTIASLDSATLSGILSGSVKNWSEIGGSEFDITPYIPIPGTGAWNSVMEYLGKLDSVVAVACSTEARMLELSANDAGALLIYSHPIDNLTSYKKLKFVRDGQPISANVKNILEEPIYPFKLSLTYATTHDKGDVAAGYLTFLIGDGGQRLIMQEGYRPAVAPVRVIHMKGQ